MYRGRTRKFIPPYDFAWEKVPPRPLAPEDPIYSGTAPTEGSPSKSKRMDLALGVNSRFTSLAQEIFELIASYLGPLDILNLRAAYHHLKRRVDESPVIRSALWLPVFDGNGQSKVSPKLTEQPNADLLLYSRGNLILLNLCEAHPQDRSKQDPLPFEANPIFAEAITHVQVTSTRLSESGHMQHIIWISASPLKLLKAMVDADGKFEHRILNEILLFRAWESNGPFRDLGLRSWCEWAGPYRRQFICSEDVWNLTLRELVTKMCMAVPEWHSKLDHKVE